MMHVANIEPPRTSPAFDAVDRMVRFAEAHGWRGEDAFRAAMILHAAGATVEEAKRLLEDCARRVQ